MPSGKRVREAPEVAAEWRALVGKANRNRGEQMSGQSRVRGQDYAALQLGVGSLALRHFAATHPVGAGLPVVAQP